MWNIPDEDEYWERRREEFENPPRRRSQWDDEEPPPLREDYLFLDEEQEELESKYGCPMVELDEDELLEIVEQFVKLTPESAKWEENINTRRNVRNDNSKNRKVL